MLQNRHKATLILICSISIAVVWPVSGITEYLHLWAPFTWFVCLGMVLLSYGRLRGVEHGIPCPEFLYFISSIAPGLLFAAFIPSSRIASVDELLLKFDGNYGYFGMTIGRLLRSHYSLTLLCSITYLALPLAGTLLYLALPTKALHRKYWEASAFGASVLICYRICPAAGPLFLLRNDFPFSIPVLEHPHPLIMANVILNAIPSGHVAAALLLFLFGRRYCSRHVQIGAGVLLFLTCFATLGLGEHYVIDLILSVPFATAIWALIHRRWEFGGISLLMVLAWLVALRQGWALTIPPVLVWICTGITMAPIVIYEHRLQLPLVRVPERFRCGNSLVHFGDRAPTKPTGIEHDHLRTGEQGL